MNLQEITSEVRAIQKVVSKETRVELTYVDVDDDIIYEMAKVNDATLFQASPSIPYHWCSIYDGNVEITIKGKQKSYKLI